MLKKSIFNRMIYKDNVTLAFNSLSCCLAEVDDDFLNLLNSCDQIDAHPEDHEMLQEMIRGGFIVDESINELDKIKILSNSGRYGMTRVWGLTIVPTLACNFVCDYCFEEKKNIYMNKEVEDAIIALIENNISNYEALEICWFGGEPLLAYDTIISLSERMMDLCKKKGKNYSATMISNGYLLSNHQYEKLRDQQVRQIQITIDGTKEVHNERRRLKGSSIGGFDRILQNVKELVKYLHVRIRINIDKTNIDQAKKVVELFDDIENRDHISFNLGLLTDNEYVNQSLSCNFFSIEEYSYLSYEFNQYLRQKGFSFHQELYDPKVKLNHCLADRIDSILIDPSGDIYKCFQNVGDTKYCIGNLLKNENILDIQARGSRYILSSPLENMSCSSCDILPLCMGGCPAYFSKDTCRCDVAKYILNEYLWDNYIKEMELIS